MPSTRIVYNKNNDKQADTCLKCVIHSLYFGPLYKLAPILSNKVTMRRSNKQNMNTHQLNIYNKCIIIVFHYSEGGITPTKYYERPLRNTKIIKCYHINDI